MKFSSLGYCIAQGFKSIGRNRIFSIASIATMALCIFILGRTGSSLLCVGFSLVAVCRLLIAVASPAAEHRL